MRTVPLVYAAGFPGSEAKQQGDDLKNNNLGDADAG
jgi:hypothetical protein